MHSRKHMSCEEKKKDGKESPAKSCENDKCERQACQAQFYLSDEDSEKSEKPTKTSGRTSRFSFAPLASFDDSFEMDSSSDSHNCRTVLRRSASSLDQSSADVLKHPVTDKLIGSESKIPGVHSHSDLVDYALLNRKRAAGMH